MIRPYIILKTSIMEDILDHPTAGNKNDRTKQKKKNTH
jgi:hypothetical protein